MSTDRLSYWIGRNVMKPDEIAGNRFLKAAVQFGDTALKYGRDRYSGKGMPLFANVLHTDHMRAPRSMTSLKSGTEPEPTIQSYYQNQQNLMRLLAALSQFTGESKYIHAAGDAADYMFSHYWYPGCGVFHWGGHGYIDLVTANTYGMKGVVHEIEDVYPYYEFLMAVTT